MGNQPSRRNLPKKSSGGTRHSRKMIDNTKKSIRDKNYDRAAKIALGAGLKDAGKGFLAAAALSGAAAYKSFKEKEISKDISKISSNATTKVIRKLNFDVTKQGRTILKSSINTTLSSLK